MQARRTDFGEALSPIALFVTWRRLKTTRASMLFAYRQQKENSCQDPRSSRDKQREGSDKWRANRLKFQFLTLTSLA